MKHLIRRDFIKFSKCQAPYANVKPPIEDFLATVLVETSHPFVWRLRYVLCFAVWKSYKHANRELNSCNNLGVFYVLLMCVGFLQPW